MKKIKKPKPDPSVIEKFVGCTVDYIMFCGFQFTIGCDEGHSVTVEAPFRFGKNDQIEEIDWVDFPIGATEMPRIVRSQITSAKIDDKQRLLIYFSTGDGLVTYDRSAYENGRCPYESYRLSIEGKVHYF